jgi:hypothetical protein
VTENAAAGIDQLQGGDLHWLGIDPYEPSTTAFSHEHGTSTTQAAKCV